MTAKSAFFKDKFSQDGLKMLQSGTTNDVTIKLKDGKEVKANKDMLIAQCPYFETMFNQNWKEGGKNCVEMMNVEEETMERVLRFLFSGDEKELILPPETDILLKIKVLDLLRLLLLDKAFEYVEEKVISIINRGEEILGVRDDVMKDYEDGYTYNITPSMILAGKLKLEKISKQCMDILSSHLELLLHDPEEEKAFKTLPFETLKTILENPGGGDLAQKTGAFKMWFESNEDELNEEDVKEILKFHLDFVSNSLNNNKDESPAGA